MKKVYKITVISNIVFEPYLKPLIKMYFGENTTVYTVPFEEYGEKEYCERIMAADLVVIWLNYEAQFNGLCYLTEIIDFDVTEVLYKKLYDYIVGITQTKIIWFLFEDCAIELPVVTGNIYFDVIDKLNLKLKEIISEQTVFINLKHIIAKVGITNAYNSKGKYRWNAPYSKELLDSAVREIHKQYLIQEGCTKKCLILDCDNVLWGGIVSEVGIENIKLGMFGAGRFYQEFQRFVYSLYSRGVILAICSKNDLFDVLEVFQNHDDMILKEEYIACFQVNWENKVDNIKFIADALNIALDSMAFVDDSPFEIEAVNKMLPEVTTILFNKEINFEQFSCFNLKNDVDVVEVKKRNETYRTDKYRKEFKALCGSYEDYILALENKIDIHRATPIEYGRISELSQRTNRCTNGRRYTVDEIKKRVLHNEIVLYAVVVADRFSDLGLVGAIEIENNCLSFFALSCRALGRNIESKMLEYVFSKHIINSVTFISTNKNESLLEKIKALSIPISEN